MSLGNRIKTLRKAQNLTQQKLADKVDVSRIYVQALESNRRLPSMKLLQRLAPALNVDVTDLLMDFASPDNPDGSSLSQCWTMESLKYGTAAKAH